MDIYRKKISSDQSNFLSSPKIQMIWFLEAVLLNILVFCLTESWNFLLLLFLFLSYCTRLFHWNYSPFIIIYSLAGLKFHTWLFLYWYLNICFVLRGWYCRTREDMKLILTLIKTIIARDFVFRLFIIFTLFAINY